MIVFPDPNVETEYTDPNGTVWEFNGTGWVRKPEDSGSGGGVLPPTESAQVPNGFQFIGTAYHNGDIGSTHTASPLCFDNVIFVCWWNSSMSQMQWVRGILGEDGSYTQDGTGYSTLPSGVSAAAVCNPCPWNVRLGNYIFQSKKNAMVYAEIDDQKNLIFHDLTILIDSLVEPTLETRGCFESIDGESIVVVCAYKDQSGGRFSKWRLNEDGTGFESLGQSINFQGGYTYSVQSVFVTETPYGYFYAQTGNSGSACGYFFASVRDDFVTIQQLNKNGIMPKQNVTPASGSAIGARYNNGRGIAIVTALGTDATAVAGPVVDEQGTMYGQEWEANNSYWEFPLIGSNGIINIAGNLTGQVGSSSVGSTCGAYGRAKARFKNFGDSPVLPYVVSADAYLISTKGERWHNVAVNSGTFVPVYTAGSDEPIVRATGDLWVSQGTSDKNLYIYKDNDLVTRGVTRDVVSAKLERLKKEIDAQKTEEQSE